MAVRQQIISPRSRRQSAFTLIELMISVAIALVLILGVNQVFKIASQTVGAGQAFSQVTRDERVAHFGVYTDVHNALTVSQPALLISSQSMIAFDKPQDLSNEPSGVPGTITINGVAQTVNNVLASSRNFRIDTLGFFASGDLYQRQTADNGNFVSATTSSNAYLWYGHVILPNNDQAKSPVGANAGWFAPGQADASATVHNDNNRFASDWILGRMAMLFVPTPPATDINYLMASSGGNPLGSATVATDGSPINSSRYDLVKSSIAQFNTAAANFPMGAYASGPLAFRASMFFRYQANPFPTKPLSAATMAGVAPVFLRHCSQFIVEYAGDYLTQDPNTGVVANGATGAQGDGVVDFVVDSTGAHKIRWYGFPRNTNNDGVIDLTHDVVPLRDVLQAPNASGGANQAGMTAPWESFNTLPVPSNNNYATTGNVLSTSQYLCSWGSESQWPIANGYGTGLPRMLRITVALDDPSGHLAAPQIYEYVIDLGAQQ